MRTAHSTGLQHLICMANVSAVNLITKMDWPHVSSSGVLLRKEEKLTVLCRGVGCLFYFVGF